MTLPTDPKARKALPVMSGVVDYFPDAIAAVAAVSKAGNDQHNPGQPLHWRRGKSSDHADTCLRHLMERGGLDTDGQRHSAKTAWRALALLQEELEAEGAPMSRGSRARLVPALVVASQRCPDCDADQKYEYCPLWCPSRQTAEQAMKETEQELRFHDSATRDPADLPLVINCGDPNCMRCYPPK